jgi:hypothetical protein
MAQLVALAQAFRVNMTVAASCCLRLPVRALVARRVLASHPLTCRP